MQTKNTEHPTVANGALILVDRPALVSFLPAGADGIALGLIWQELAFRLELNQPFPANN
jgi:hypothetical protein